MNSNIMFYNIFGQKFQKTKQQNIEPTIDTFYEPGKLHPISEEINLIKNIMAKHGFQHCDSPIIDTEYYNFDALNVTEMHPARGSHDTFYLKSGMLLRTHTSNFQLRAFQNFSGPQKLFHCGRVYRKDDDRTHSTMFHQFECLYVDDFNVVTFAHLKWFIREILEEIFGQKNIKLRFRSSYFPFTEPSIEVDALARHTHNGIEFVCDGQPADNCSWLELLGGGMVAQNILHRGNYKNHTAFACGIGIDRIVMLKHQISNINDLYKNRFPFLRKYGVESGVK